ncbi:unnamed protein product [Mytilus coruscus]|uniref:Reverse transcriptase domain-containing protein n=1 Tax=Mytilus coruscus TaxID=42192 RepID=A0A6J8EIF4_MYTCO|nr:unnamed protein product [Mytilus coruscus]
MAFRSLPFGIAVAPRIFTKLMKVPMALLRCLGVRLIVYLDDILIMNQSNQKILSDLSTVLSILRGLGFLINAKTSVMEPSQTIEFLGEHKVDDLFSPEGEDRENKEQFQLNARTQESVSKRFSSVDSCKSSSPSESSRCPSPVLERDKGLCFSPVLSNKYVSSKSSGGEKSDNFDNSNLAIPGLVPSVTSIVNRLSSVTSHESQHFIVSHGRTTPTDSEKKLKLAGWMVSEDHLNQLEFQRKLKNYSLGLGNREPDLLTTVPGISGLAGVAQGKLIPFQHLWPLS